MAKTNKKDLRKPPILFPESQAILADIEVMLDGDFLSYWISESGSLVEEDVIVFHRILAEQARRPRLYFLLKSNGGQGTGALRIINLLRHYYEHIIALVPLDCASAATMLALGCDEIRMGPLAYLSAIDTSITHQLSPIDHKYNDKVSVSQNELDRVLRLWDAKRQPNDTNPYRDLYAYLHPLVFGAVDRASSLSIKITSEILSYHMTDEQKIKTISEHLNADYPAHSYPITSREAKKIGLHVNDLDENLNSALLRLNDCYSETAQNAHTDYDELNYHDNEILKIIELKGQKCYFQTQKDWHYLTEERRYISLNDESSWKISIAQGRGIAEKRFHIR
jgi:ClpP class serine protease